MDRFTREVRKFVYDTFVETAHPPIAQQVADRFGITRPEAVAVFRALEEERQLTLVPGTDRIFMAHPFAALATPFRCRLRSGRKYSINCSFDTLACHVMLDNAPMTVSGFCHHTGAQVEMLLDGGRVEWQHPEETVVYLGIPARRWWQNIIDTCGNQFLFFASAAHAEAWECENAREGAGRTIPVPLCLRVVEPVYRDKLALDYERPTPAALGAHLADLGLTGDFWTY